jgi:malate/lactate dehydrogenase
MPAVIGRNGILKKVYFSLNKEEEEKLQNSVDVIKKAIISLDNE